MTSASFMMMQAGAFEEEEEMKEATRETLLGETAAMKAQTGGFFSALMTSGSFMMMQAGAFEEEERTDEAGRDPE